MSILSKTVLAGAATLVLSAGAASAAVVCNREGDCWRTRGQAAYGPDLRLSLHPDGSGVVTKSIAGASKAAAMAITAVGTGSRFVS
jgi:hypothetical protein